MTLVCNGRILDDTLKDVKTSDTIFLVLESQPPSWKVNSENATGTVGSVQEASSSRLDDVRTRPSSQDDDPLLEQIKELELAISMLVRSNQELLSAGPDPDFEEAIEENVVAIARYSCAFWIQTTNLLSVVCTNLAAGCIELPCIEHSARDARSLACLLGDDPTPLCHRKRAKVEELQRLREASGAAPPRQKGASGDDGEREG